MVRVLVGDDHGVQTIVRLADRSQSLARLLRLKPASMSRRVFSVAKRVQLPLLPLPRTQTRTLIRPPD